MSSQIYLAVDLGASSGRVLAAQLNDGRFSLSEVHRFANGPVSAHDHMYWDLLGLWQDVQLGLSSAAEQYGTQVRSLGVDTWGVDYGLLGPGDELLGNPRHYRDPRTRGVMEATWKKVPREQIFTATGLQFMEINTLYQLAAMRQQNPRLLDMAEDFLMIPDLFHWLLTGQKLNEFTNATTTQCLNPRTGEWDDGLLSPLQIPRKLFRTPTLPGTNLGKLRPSVAAKTKLLQAQVIVPGTHDTASAVLAVPTSSLPSNQPDWCYISSGTWSLMGVEVPDPIINDRCLALNFTNEGGVGGTVRVLKNIAGLWLIQECRRCWQEAGHDYSWEQLNALSSRAEPWVSLIDPDHSRFTAPPHMPDEVAAFCRETNQPVPVSEGAILRCILQSLALRYRQVLQWLEQLTGSQLRTIHIVGGGSQNEPLNQMTADACHRRVVAGPVEATAIGNGLMQAIAMHDLESITAAREVVRRSFPVQEYLPGQTSPWDDAFERFQKISGRLCQ